VKVARWVWSRGKDGDYIKVLPIAIKVTGALVEDVLEINYEVAQSNSDWTIFFHNQKAL